VSAIWYIAATVGIVSALGAVALRNFSRRRRLYDHPNARSGHAQPVPRLGGISIAFSALAGTLVAAAAGVPALPALVPIVISALLMTFVGLLDDMWPLGAAAKFCGQVLAIAVLMGTWPLFASREPWWVVLIAAGWLVTYTNQFNFMDGSDGLAAGVALVQGASLGAITMILDWPDIAALALLVAAAAAGFLIVNYPPASIFMGDSGSHFLGFTLALIAALAWRAGVHPAVVLAVMSPFVFDATFTLFARAFRGEALTHAHRSHLYQRLLDSGWPAPAVAWAYYAWCVTAGVSAWYVVRLTAQSWASGTVLLLLNAVPVAVFMWIVMRRERRRRRDGSATSVLRS
jgi:UDP-N-acetylmuramyl pentapeptide phosphotransferase/UDP-N-acetylglucosamine-1-phosphate transferase